MEQSFSKGSFIDSLLSPYKKAPADNTDRLLSRRPALNIPHTLQAKTNPLQKTSFKAPSPETIEQTALDLFKKNLHSQAETLIQAFHARGFGAVGTYCLLGNIYYQKNQFKKALDAYKKALEKDPSHLESLAHISLLRFDLGDYQKGSVAYNKALSQIQQNKKSRWDQYITSRHLQSGRDYFSMGLYHEALLEFLKAHSKEKSNPLPIELKIIRCLWHLDRKKSALKKLLLLKKTNPLSIPVRLMIGEFYFHFRNIPMAVNEWEKILRFDPKNKSALMWLSKTQNIQNSREEPLA